MSDKSTKYDIQDELFDEVHGVLKNKLKIIDKEELDSVEAKCLSEAYEKAFVHFDNSHHFTAKDVSYLHKIFLGKVFKWAGTYRSVDMVSPGIRYCHAQFIQQSMSTYSKRLTGLTPFPNGLDKVEVIKRIAEIHGELIVIHPFRDGNGRTTRLLCDLILMQAGYPPIDTEIFYSAEFVKEYHAAIQKSWGTGEYVELINLFTPLIH